MVRNAQKTQGMQSLFCKLRETILQFENHQKIIFEKSKKHLLFSLP